MFNPVNKIAENTFPIEDNVSPPPLNYIENNACHKHVGQTFNE